MGLWFCDRATGRCEYDGHCTFAHDDRSVRSSANWSVVASLRRNKRTSESFAPAGAPVPHARDLFGANVEEVRVDAWVQRPQGCAYEADTPGGKRLSVFLALACGESVQDAPTHWTDDAMKTPMVMKPHAAREDWSHAQTALHTGGGGGGGGRGVGSSGVLRSPPLRKEGQPRLPDAHDAVVRKLW